MLFTLLIKTGKWALAAGQVFNIFPCSVAEEDYEEMDDYFGDEEEYNEKESEEGTDYCMIVNINLNKKLFK